MSCITICTGAKQLVYPVKKKTHIPVRVLLRHIASMHEGGISDIELYNGDDTEELNVYDTVEVGATIRAVFDQAGAVFRAMNRDRLHCLTASFTSGRLDSNVGRRWDNQDISGIVTIDAGNLKLFYPVGDRLPTMRDIKSFLDEHISHMLRKLMRLEHPWRAVLYIGVWSVWTEYDKGAAAVIVDRNSTVPLAIQSYQQSNLDLLIGEGIRVVSQKTLAQLSDEKLWGKMRRPNGVGVQPPPAKHCNGDDTHVAFCKRLAPFLCEGHRPFFGQLASTCRAASWVTRHAYLQSDWYRRCEGALVSAELALGDFATDGYPSGNSEILTLAVMVARDIARPMHAGIGDDACSYALWRGNVYNYWREMITEADFPWPDGVDDESGPAYMRLQAVEAQGLVVLRRVSRILNLREGS